MFYQQAGGLPPAVRMSQSVFTSTLFSTGCGRSRKLTDTKATQNSILIMTTRRYVCRLAGSENECGQLIQRVDDLQAHENKRSDHQIDAKMHKSLKPNAWCGLRASHGGPRTISIPMGNNLLKH